MSYTRGTTYAEVLRDSLHETVSTDRNKNRNHSLILVAGDNNVNTRAVNDNDRNILRPSIGCFPQ